jgi:hypothetical protein
MTTHQPAAAVPYVLSMKHEVKGFPGIAELKETDFGQLNIS